MQLDKRTIKRILKENKDVFDALEKYDRTRKLPFQRKRIDVTLSVRTIEKLKAISAKTKKPMSRIIEENIQEFPLPKTHPKPNKPSRLDKRQPPLDIEPVPVYIG